MKFVALSAGIVLGLLVVAGCGGSTSHTATAPNAEPGGSANRPGEQVQATDAGGSEPDRVILRYELPAQQPADSSAQEWKFRAPIVNGRGDPNLIAYDQAYIERYVKWALNSPNASGAASYVVWTPDGKVEFQSGLDEIELGREFDATRLVRFLETRVRGKRQVRSFVIHDAELRKWAKKNYQTAATHRLKRSPWDRDVQTVVALLGSARYLPAEPLFKDLLQDSNVAIRQAAVRAMGQLATPTSIRKLCDLLGDETLGNDPASALGMIGPPVIDDLTDALAHRDMKIRRQALYALGRVQPSHAAIPACTEALEHPDSQIRRLALWIIADRISRGGPWEGLPYLESFGRMLGDPSNEVRYRVASTLSSMASLVAPIRDDIEAAAQDDSSSRSVKLRLNEVMNKLLAAERAKRASPPTPGPSPTKAP